MLLHFIRSELQPQHTKTIFLEAAVHLLYHVQVRSHHFCSHLSEEVRQCLIYDSAEAEARLIGVEYIISRKLFEQLPQDERRYWHSHAYEV